MYVVAPALVITIAAFVVTACGEAVGSGQPSTAISVSPISKVHVDNQTDSTLYARMHWPDGFVQVARLEPGGPQYLTGAIGTSGFPRTIDILDADCDLVHTVRGLEPGNAGLITVDDERARIKQIHEAMSDWTEAASVPACGGMTG